MNENCKKSCGTCGDNSNASVPEEDENPVADCQNNQEYGDATCDSYASSYDFCEIEPVFMNENCAKSCGTCGDNSNASVPEEDENPVPEEDENPVTDCENNPAYGDSTCDSYASSYDFCEIEPVFMNKNCAKSCGTCGDNSNASVPEEDENPVADCQNNQEYGDATCDYYAKEKYCESEPTFMNAYCAKSCG
jgi:hypothetical protein